MAQDPKTVKVWPAEQERGMAGKSEDVVDDGGLDFAPDWRFYMIFITLSTVTLIAALDATSLSVALPIITDALGGGAIEAFWSGTSFLLTSTVFQPIFATFSHIFGRKLALYIALVLFLIGAIVAAVSNTFTILLVARSIQGVGGGGLIVIAEVIATDLVPLRHRGKWFGFLGAMWALGSVIGPIVGGAFAENVTWRWIFWVNLPFIGVAAIFTTLFVKLAAVTGSTKEKLARFDWFGALLFMASTTSLLIPISWGGINYAWSAYQTIVPLVLGICGIAAFVVYERLVPAEPMFPRTIYGNRSLVLTYFQTIVHGLILWGIIYYLPLYYEGVKGYSPIVTGLAVFPESFTVAPICIVVSIVVSVFGRYRAALWLGWLITILGCGLLYLLGPDTTPVQWIFINIVVGIGTGVLFPTMTFSVQASVDVKDIAFGVAFSGFFRSFGQTLGIAVGGSIFQNQIREKILGYPSLASSADLYSQDATALVSIIQTMEYGMVRTQLTRAFADSLGVIWLVMCGLAVLGGVASVFTQEYTLDQILETKQGINRKKVGLDFEGGCADIKA